MTDGSLELRNGIEIMNFIGIMAQLLKERMMKQNGGRMAPYIINMRNSHAYEIN